MSYVDYNYYISGYLKGRDPLIPESEFCYWEQQACTEVNKITFDSLVRNSKFISNRVKDCVCEISELLYQSNIIIQQSFEYGAAGIISSYSNDGESASFDLSYSDYTGAGKEQKIRKIIYRYLGSTGLLYQGLYEMEE